MPAGELPALRRLPLGPALSRPVPLAQPEAPSAPADECAALRRQIESLVARHALDVEHAEEVRTRGVLGGVLEGYSMEYSRGTRRGT